MMDIDTLLARLRAAAAEHVSPHTPGPVAVRSWPPAADVGARRLLIDAVATSPAPDVAAFLVPDHTDFLDLAYAACLGRAADPGGRGHYLRRLQQGSPRLEVLAELSASAEGDKFGRGPAWPYWLRPLIWGLEAPLVRRAARATLRRVEARIGKRARRGAMGLLWRLSTAIDDADQAHRSDREALARETAAVRTIASEAQAEASSARATSTAFADHVKTLAADSDAATKAVAAMRARLAVLEYARDTPVAATPVAAMDAKATADPALEGYYVALESTFRGDPRAIRAQFEADYLDYMMRARSDAGDAPCIDIGCGRGEWLDVLRAHGFEARGVDANPAMAAQARAAGLDVIVDDALAYLRAQRDDSALAISAFHLVEHLEFATLYRIIGECRRVLAPRGLLILETPNPENLWVATHTFHHDPTHRNPLTPESLEFLVNHHGLETVKVLRLHPYPDEARLPGNDPVTERLNAMTCGGQDFAVVARKSPSA